MCERSKLRLNWIEGRPGLSGGIKSNRLIAEAMHRRGHDVTISFLPPIPPWPAPWRVRSIYRRLRRGIRSKNYKHHLQQSEVKLNEFPSHFHDSDCVPDADVTFASWWAVWACIQSWPESKGLKVHYVRHYETHGGDESEVIGAYQLPGPRVVISSWLGRILRDFGHEEIEYVPNGVDWSQFDSKPRKRNGNPTIGLLMGHAGFKDTPTGMRAIRRLNKRFANLRVIGFGPFPLRKGLDVPGNVEYHQSPGQDLIPKLYQQADCWIIPSKAEGFGMPGIEAMASRCPIVSTRCGGPEDFVKEGDNGYLVDVGDDEAIADRVSQILSLSDEDWVRMSGRSYEIAQEFDWDRSAEKLESAIYSWLDARGKFDRE